MMPVRLMTAVTRRAYAKINLTLDVGARRPDGYHDIRSVMHRVALHDTLTVTRTPDVPGVRLEVTGDESAGVPADPSNLVHRAAVRLQKVAAARGAARGDRSGLHIALHKRLPAQAGLGGGSSDAGATLQAVNDLLGLGLSPRRLAGIGAALGADVPFFLSGGAALAEGLGERLTPLPILDPPWLLVVVKPPVGVSTAAAYAALDAVPGRVCGAATEAWLAGARDPANDFEAVVLPAYPEIGAAHRLLSETAGAGASFGPRLCGSGAALFRRVGTIEEAERLAAQVEAAGAGRAWITRTCGGEA